jgi:hypothetical protein
VLLLLLLSACEEKIDDSLMPDETGLLVVEGLLTNENKNHLVKLSLPYGKQNGLIEPATGASVFLFEDSTLYALQEFPPGSGNYYTPTRRAVTGRLYTLYIEYNGQEYFAQDSPVPVQPLQNLRYHESGEGYTLALDPAGQDANYVEHSMSWANTDACGSSDSCEGKVVFYDLKTIDVNEMYKPEKEIFQFPKGTTVIRRKYSVSAAYRAFLRSMLSETEWRGGVFDIQRSNVETNLSNGAVGFFAVCSVVGDTTVVE